MTTPMPTRRIAYQPALDGLRGVAVLGVVAYHAGIERLQGGFLGVSTFFTLSGFLITSLLIRERAASGRVALGEFYGRRLRRLMPAALVTITATILLAAVIGDDSQLARMRGDGLASLLHFSNWWFIAEGDSYGALFESPSFFRQFWSLAVEEQYYLFVPPLITAAMGLTGRLGRRRGPTAFTGVLVAMTAMGLAWPMVLEARGASPDRLYFATDTRLGELTVGALLALWFVHRDQQVVRSRAGLAVATVGTVTGIAVMGAMWTSAHPSDTYLYRGGLALHAAFTVVVIIAAVAPSGPVRAILALEPLRRLGVVSYGVYLLHWPILLWLQTETTLGPVGRFVLGTAITLGAALVLNRFVEVPFRQAGSMSPVRAVCLALPASVMVAVLVVAVSAWRPPEDAPIDFAAAQQELDALIDDSTPSGGATTLPAGGDGVVPGPAGGAAAAVRMATFGDSTALITGLGILQWAAANPGRIEIVRGDAKLGCGLLSGGLRRMEDRTVTVPDECDGWLDDWLRALDGNELDVAVVQLGAWEITDHQRESGGPFESIDDPGYEADQVDQLDTMIAALHEHADLVVLLAHPDVGEGRLSGVPTGVSYPEYDPARAARWRELLAGAAERATAAGDPTTTVDLAGWIDAHPDDTRLRPDGVHFSQETSIEVAEWLVPEILRLGRGRERVPGTADPTPHR